MTSKRTAEKKLVLAATVQRGLASDFRELIGLVREKVAPVLDSALTTLYWQIGRWVRRGIMKENRPDFGVEIVSALWRQLTWTYLKRLDVPPE